METKSEFSTIFIAPILGGTRNVQGDTAMG